LRPTPLSVPLAGALHLEYEWEVDLATEQPERGSIAFDITTSNMRLVDDLTGRTLARLPIHPEGP
jgi:hypothetical protein